MKLGKRCGALALVLAMLVSLFAMGGASVSALSGAGLSANAGYNVAFGCDVSYWNVGGDTLDYSLVDFAKMKADGCDFAILRIGYEASASRSDVMDSAFVQFYNNARAAGMDLGVYFYALSTTYAGAVQDAQWVINVIEKYDMYFEYPIYYDVEDSNQVALGSSAMESLCKGWCETLAAAGYFPGIYSGQYQCFNKLSSSFMETYDGWVANVKVDGHGTQYDPTSMSKSSVASMWQYAWYDYNYDGIGLDMLDVNVAYKDYPTIMATYGYNNLVTRHVVSFESNGGSTVGSVAVTDGSTLALPTAPTKYGFDFAGWYCNPELTDPYDESMAVTYGFTLYAKWDEAYWGANTNLMPNSTQLVTNGFEGTDETVWPYWNSDEYNSVTMYNGVTSSEWSWPSASMSYENSFDSSNDSYIYVKKDGTAQFNADITYMDEEGTLKSVKLSQIAGNGDNDFNAGYMEFFVDFRSYLEQQNDLPASGNVKFTNVTYYVIGVKDSYVTLYDMKLTPKFDVEAYYKSLYTNKVQQNSGAGSYVYNNGTLTLKATEDSGYSVTLTSGVTFNPTQMIYLVADLSSTVDFNISMEITRADGVATLELRKEFFDVFGFAEAPEALLAGEYTPVMNMNGYYYWNGGLVNESTVKSVTITLQGKGTLVLDGLQISRNEVLVPVNDGLYASGTLSAGGDAESTELTSSVYVVSGGLVSRAEVGMTVAQFTANFDQANVAVYDENGNLLASDARVASGMTVSTTAANAVSYTIALRGDVNGDGIATTADARLMLAATLGASISDWQRTAAEYNNDGTLSTSDVRALLSYLVA